MGLPNTSVIKVSSAKLPKTRSTRPMPSPADRAGAEKTITISGAQVRAARAFLGWTSRALAAKAAVRIFTIEWIEGDGKITGKDRNALAAIKAMLEDGGIEFTYNEGISGVRLHPKKRPK
jgi:hypothetical protein